MGSGRHGWQGRGLRQAGAAFGALMLAACASTSQPQPVMPGTATMREADAIAAAKRSPIARPDERSLYPEQQPPPLPQRQAPPPLPPSAAGAAPPPPAAVVAAPPAAPVAPAPEYQAPAPQQPPEYAGVDDNYPPPSAYYVWAPGYWNWYGGRYVWIGGAWIPRRPGYAYVRPRWIYTDYGWSFEAGGWANAGSTVVVYPVHRPRDYAYHYHRQQRPRTPIYTERNDAREPRRRTPVYERPTPSRPTRSTITPGSSGSSRMPSRPGRRIR